MESYNSYYSAPLAGAYGPLMAGDGIPLLAEWSTAIYVENDGDIRAGGILTSSTFEGPSWNFEAVGFTGYARGMPYVGNGYMGIRVDPIDCARVIWTHVQSCTGGNIGLELDDTDTGGEVSIGTELEQVEFDTESGPVSFEAGPFRLRWYQEHDLQGVVDTLAGDTPFDYREHHYWKEDGTIGHRMEIGYPGLGRRRTDLRFQYGVNVFEPVSVNRDGSIYASGTMVLGAGEGAAMIKAIKEPASRPAGRLRRIAVVVDSSIRSARAASDRADAENQWRARIDDVDTIIVRDHPNAPLGSAQIGDEIHIEGRGEWINTDMWVRILSISFRPEDGGVAEYSIARTDKLIS